MTRFPRLGNLRRLLSVLLFALMGMVCASGRAAEPAAGDDAELRNRLQRFEQFVSEYCVDCHSTAEPAGKLDLQAFDFGRDQFSDPQFPSQPWERILRRLDTRQMPPASAMRPEDAEYQEITAALSAVLDQRSRAFPRPGRVAAIRRLTRLEYQYSIRDLLGIEVDASDYLPKDESSHGFDNITVAELSPTHLNRYLSAAQSISRLAIGGEGNGPVGITIRQPPDRSQEEHVAGLPFGTRGGLLIRHHFHRSGDYEIELKLTRDRDEKIEGLNRKHNIDVLVDRQRRHRFTVEPVKGRGGYDGNDDTQADAHLRVRIPVPAGERSIGVTFPKLFSSLTEDKRQPFDANFNRHRHPRRTPAIYQVSIVGPLPSSSGPSSGSPSSNGKSLSGPGQTECRTLVFGEGFDPSQADEETAREILERLATRAYRRPVDQEDLDLLLQFFRDGNEAGGFEQGIELALTAILVNPNFLFRIEGGSHIEAGSRIEAGQQSAATAPVSNVSDYELASRLSYFLWSSLPDERLLELAAAGRLQDDAVLKAEVERMLADEKSQALVDNFASQWLYLVNLDTITPDLRLFPDFDDNLRQAFRQETKLLFGDMLQGDRSVLTLIRPEVTFLNERLATHYVIPGVRGSEFRPVPVTPDSVTPDSRRGGILRQGSVLMVTSYATRTSPTIRGNWILENIFGTPAPPPPPNVPNLKENTSLEVLSVRDRLEVHRQNPACASCHDLMDPLGFALENFDAVGRWRDFDGTIDIDSRGQLPDGTAVGSVDELEAAVLARPNVFAQTVTEKLMTYALGRVVEAEDLPAVRRIVAAAADENYRFSSLITGIVLSDPFRKRSPESP